MVRGGDTPIEGPARFGPRCPIWIVVLVVALVGATSASTVWHRDHGTDKGCVVCQLRYHSVADLAGAPRIRPHVTPEPVAASGFVVGIAHHSRSSIPTRAPPA